MIVYQKARIFDPDSPKNGFSVQFNPNTLEYSAGIDFRSQKGVAEQGGDGQMQVSEFQSSPLGKKQSARLSVRLFFHSYINELTYSDVRPTINRIRAFLPAAAESAATGNTAPKSSKPKISFAWGTMTHTGTLESFQATYQMFAFDGTPVQAEVSMGENQESFQQSMQELPQEQQAAPEQAPEAVQDDQPAQVQQTAEPAAREMEDAPEVEVVKPREEVPEPEEAADVLPGVALAVLEANHDVETLRSGPYPYYLKRRILGDEGHLSNESAARFAVTLAEQGTAEIVLAHLSRENNTPAMARNAVETALSAAGLCPALSVAPRDTLGQAHVVRGGTICRK